MVKFTGNGTPLRQWLHLDAFELIEEKVNLRYITYALVEKGVKSRNLRMLRLTNHDFFLIKIRTLVGTESSE